MKKTALLVVDVQNLLVEHCYQGQQIVERIKRPRTSRYLRAAS